MSRDGRYPKIAEATCEGMHKGGILETQGAVSNGMSMDY